MNRQPFSMPKITALYSRLSKEDALSGDSLSIQNQRQILENHARSLGYVNLVHFSDDGTTGLRFDRDGWQQLMDEVEAGNVECCVMKDMTRWGRDYIQVGLHMELFRNKASVLSQSATISTASARSCAECAWTEGYIKLTCRRYRKCRAC